MRLIPAQIECLLTAILAVNQYPLEKAWALLPRLREAGLTDPARVVAMDMRTAIEALSAAGYDRKNLTWMFAERAKALMSAIVEDRLDGLATAIAACDKVSAASLLSQVHGIGPKVIDNAWTLLIG